MARQMKDSGIEWIGEIPADWKVSLLKYSIRWKSEKGQPDATVLSLYRDYGIVPKDSRDDNHNVTSLDTSGYKVVDVGDFVINKMKAWQGSMGVSGYRGIVSPAYHVCEITNPEIDKQYFHHLLRNPTYLPEYMRLSTGMRIGQWDLGFDDFKNIPFVIPPVDEQRRIVAYIDRKCAEIDAVIERTKATIEEYKKLKQAVITEAVTQGVRGPRPMKDSGIEWIGEIPEEWEVVQIKHLKAKEPNSFVDGPFGSNLKSIHYVDDGDVYVVESGFITTGKFVFKKFKTITAEHFETIKRSECKGKDIIIAKIGANFGMAAELPELDKPSVVSGNSLKITLNQALILNSIFVYELGTAKSQGGYVGLYNETAQPALSLSSLNSFKLVVAPMVEQQEIANYLDEKCAALDTLIAKKTALLTELETYKKSLIYEYVTGKKEVK